MTHTARNFFVLMLISIVWCSLLGSTRPLFAQEVQDAQDSVEDPTASPDQAPQGSAVIQESFWRWGWYEWSTERFQGSHPFYDMTGNKFFRDGKTSLNSTQDNTGLFITGNNQHEQNSSALTKLMHGLPAMSFEYIVPTGFSILPAVSAGVYYTNTWLTDQTASTSKGRRSQVPLIEMRNHFYFSYLSTHLFTPPQKNGLEIYYGLGVVRIETTLRNGFRGHGTIQDDAQTHFDLDHYLSEPIFFQRIGLTNSGDNFGLSLELYLIGKGKAIDNPFWNSERIPTTPQKRNIDLQGVFMRFGWGMYSFWD